MIACCYSSFILILIFILYSSIGFAYEQPSSIDNDDENKIESNYQDQWQTNDEETKYHKASYQHHQSLLANIYAPNRTYISMHDDRIYPSNFSYFTFNNLGTYRFILISSRGDADLYVSTRHKHVTYDNYEFSSCTCGIDEILIDPYVKRPVYIGVYGHSQYQISHYRLLVELVDSTIPLDATYSEKSNDDGTYSNTPEQQTVRSTNQKPSRVPPTTKTKGEEDQQHLLWNILLWILNFLVEVLT